MSSSQDPRYAQNRKIANDVVKWYFENCKSPGKTASKDSGPKLSEEMWAELLVEAISSFNRGLEHLEPEGRRASVDVNEILDMVGPEALNIVAFLVSKQGLHREAAIRELIVSLNDGDDPKKVQFLSEDVEEYIRSNYPDLEIYGAQLLTKFLGKKK
jgi:hypothetical protein